MQLVCGRSRSRECSCSGLSGSAIATNLPELDVVARTALRRGLLGLRVLDLLSLRVEVLGAVRLLSGAAVKLHHIWSNRTVATAEMGEAPAPRAE